MFEKYSNIKFHANLSSGSYTDACEPMDRWTNVMKLIGAFHHYAKCLKMEIKGTA